MSHSTGAAVTATIANPAPRAKYCATVKEFLFLAYTVDAINGTRPQRIWWSAIVRSDHLANPRDLLIMRFVLADIVAQASPENRPVGDARRCHPALDGLLGLRPRCGRPSARGMHFLWHQGFLDPWLFEVPRRVDHHEIRPAIA
jgi:hypothetical protein